MKQFLLKGDTMRFIIILISLIFSTSAYAAQGQHTKSPLVCYEVDGMAEIALRIIQPTQVGSLGNPPSTDIWFEPGTSWGQKKAGCEFNSQYQLAYSNVIWLESPRWLLMLEVVDIGNNILMWRPADILDKNEWVIPRGCPVYQTNVVRGQGISANRFLNQGIVLPRYCTKAVLRGNRGNTLDGLTNERIRQCQVNPLAANADREKRRLRRQLCGRW